MTNIDLGKWQKGKKIIIHIKSLDTVHDHIRLLALQATNPGELPLN